MVFANPRRSGLGPGWAAAGLVIAGAAVLGVGFSGALSARAWGRLSLSSSSAPRSGIRGLAAPEIADGAPDPSRGAILLPTLRPRTMAPEDAARFNASVPFAPIDNPPSPPFRLADARADDRARATDCLTAAVYYEAASQSAQGQRAVAQVVLNRLTRPAFPKTVCGVVFQGAERTTGCQFTFTCDGALDRPPSARGWAAARAVASAALAGSVEPAVGGATHYHTQWVAPDWSGSLLKVAHIGAHIFYDWPGAGAPDVSPTAYAGHEPDAARQWRIGRAPFDTPDEVSARPVALAPPPSLRAAVVPAPAGPLTRLALVTPLPPASPTLAQPAPVQASPTGPSRLPVPKDW